MTHTWCSRAHRNCYVLAASAAVWEEPADIRLHMLFMEMTTFALTGPYRGWQLYQHEKTSGTTKSVSSDCRYHIKSTVLMIFVRNNRSCFQRFQTQMRCYRGTSGERDFWLDWCDWVFISPGQVWRPRRSTPRKEWRVREGCRSRPGCGCSPPSETPWTGYLRRGRFNHHQCHRNWSGSYLQH